MTLTHAEAASQASRAQAGMPPFDSFGSAHEQDVRLMLANHLPGCDAASVTASWRDGVVRLEGTVSDSVRLARFKNQVTAAFPGVTIDDRLDWVVPDCGIGYA